MKRNYRVLLPIFCVLFLGGCSGELPLNHRMIVQNAGVDINGEEVTVSINAYLADRGAAGEKGDGSDVFFSQNGVSVSHAAEQIGAVSGRSPYFSHNQAVVIGQKTAEAGIGRALSFFAEHSECSKTIPLLVAADGAEELLSRVGEEGSIPARELASLGTLGEQSGNTVNTEVFGAMQCLYDGTRDFCVPIVATEETEEGTHRIRLDGTALFTGDRMAAVLSPTQTKGVLLTSGKAKLLSYDLRVLSKTGTPVKLRMLLEKIQRKIVCEDEEDRAKIRIEIACSASLTEWDFAAWPIPDRELTEKSLRACEAALVRSVEEAVAICAGRYQADPFDFGRQFAQQQPQWWERYRTQWSSLLSRCEVSVTVQCSLKTEDF